MTNKRLNQTLRSTAHSLRSFLPTLRLPAADQLGRCAVAQNLAACHTLSMQMVIRIYQETDEAQVIELWHLCNLVVPWNNPKQDIQLKLQVQAELFLVGIIDERVVASVMAGYDGHRGWLYSLAVAPEMQRQGLGRRIVEAAEAKLKALGCRKVNLQIRAFNTQVIDFYKSLGFAVEERVSMGKRL